MVSSANALTVTRNTSYSSSQVAGGGAGMCLSGSTLGRTSSGRASSKTLSSACSSPVSSGRGAELRPPGSVSRKVSLSSASVVNQSGACSCPGASGCVAELGLYASSLKGKARQCREVSFSELFDRCMSPYQRVAHVSDSVKRLWSTQIRDMHAVMNSCGSMRGVVMQENHLGCM